MTIRMAAALACAGWMLGACATMEPVGGAMGDAGAAGVSAERLERLEAVTHGYVDDGRIAGVVTLVSRRGEIVHLDAYGMADIEAGRPMTEDTYFYLYSMTKPVASVALLMLYEEGAFQLTDPVSDYLPELADLKVFDGVDGAGRMRLVDAKRPPTIQDVFRHTAGFTYGFFGDSPVDQAYREAGVFDESLEDLTAKLGELPLLYQPGERWVYSVAHDVQARLVEVISGMPFDEFCRTRIFEPLGMTETVFGRPASMVDQFAVIYTRDDDGALTPSGALDQGNASEVVFGGYSLSSTITDYAIFAEMLLNGGERNGVRLLSPKTVDLMTTNHLPEGIRLSPGEGYGLGVRVVEDPAAAGNLTSAGTFGWSGAAGTHFFVDPEEELIAVFMIQSNTEGQNVANEFETLVYQSLVD